MCFQKKHNDENEKTSILKNNRNKTNKNYDLFNNYNDFKRQYLFKKDDYVVEFNGVNIDKLILEIEKYINSWFNKSNFKIIGCIKIKYDSYYILSDSITKNQLKIKYTLIDNDPIKTLIINEVIHSV